MQHVGQWPHCCYSVRCNISRANIPKGRLVWQKTHQHFCALSPAGCTDEGAPLLHPRCKTQSWVWENELFDSKHPLSWRSWRCSDCPLLLVVKCCGFICRTWTSVEVDHEAFFLPLNPQKKEIIFLPENMCFFFFLILSTQRQKADRRSVWTRFLANVTLCPRTWHRQNCCAHICKLQKRGLSRENSRKANRDKQKQKEEQDRGKKWENEMQYADLWRTCWSTNGQWVKEHVRGVRAGQYQE